MAREDEGDGSLIRKFEQIVLELLDVGFTQPMQGGHRSILEKVRHDVWNTLLTVAIEQQSTESGLHIPAKRFNPALRINSE
jgi:hypothetical protein